VLIAWVATGLVALIEDCLHDRALTLVNAINTATDRAELDVLVPQVERWLSKSTLHVRAYLRADAYLAGLEYAFDPRMHTPMTESQDREREGVPPDCTHNAEARERLSALCRAMLTRTANAG
jgi:hypothetical protein